MSKSREELYSEIEQMLSQYREEVPGRRRAWPKSIQNAVRELHRLGLNWSEISKQTKIPYHTVLQWRVSKPKASFNELKIIPSPSHSKILSSKSVPVNVGTVTVTTSNGVCIEGLFFESLLLLLPRLGVNLQ
jgi:hypothetical protein